MTIKFQHLKKYARKTLFVLIFVFAFAEILAQGAHRILLRTSNQYRFWNTYRAERTYKQLNWFQYEYRPFVAFDKKNSFLNQPFPKRKGFYRVGIFGGSVAENFGEFLIKNKVQLLQNVSWHENGKEQEIQFEVINLARGSYRQPQQMIASVLALESIDLFLSIEGFNDVALSHHSVCRPENWPQYIHQFDPQLDSVYKKLAEGLRRLFNVSYGFTKSPFAIAKVVHYFLGDPLLRIFHLFESKHIHFLQAECTNRYIDPDLIEKRVQAWTNDVRKHHLLLKGSQKEIYTFLQPNQYLPGTKSWSKEEEEIFKNFDIKYKNYFAKSYGVGVRHFKEMATTNDHLIDLTDVFLDLKDQIYVDECCHFGDKGNEILFSKIKPIIFKSLKKQFQDLP